MKLLKLGKKPEGQALAEMVLAIPILFLFIAGIVQFTVIFLCYVQFEHACGEAARQYAAGIIDKQSLAPAIQDNLGYMGRYFDSNSLTVRIQEPRGSAAQAMDKASSLISFIPLIINYDGCEWSVNARMHPPFCFKAVFPDGIPFHTVLQVYRYPK